jgi:hypothetical protein
MHFSLSRRLLAVVVAGFTAAAVGFACSSSSTGAPPMAPAAEDGSMDESTGPAVPCADAMLDLPKGSAPGGACGDCLQSMCTAELAVCMDDCQCIAAIECLAVNADNYTLCPTALTIIGAGDNGLKLLAACIVMKCPVCNEVPD